MKTAQYKYAGTIVFFLLAVTVVAMINGRAEVGKSYDSTVEDCPGKGGI
jgi:hypothetical protein